MRLGGRAYDARLDAVIAEHELRGAGVIEPDEPTPLSHARYMERLRAEFTPEERLRIRMLLGMTEHD